MRNVILALVAAVVIVAGFSSEALALGGRRGGGGNMTVCNMGQQLQLQVAPVQATPADLLPAPAPKTLSLVKPLPATRTKSGLDYAGLAKLNGDKPLGTAFSNVAAK